MSRERPSLQPQIESGTNSKSSGSTSPAGDLDLHLLPTSHAPASQADGAAANSTIGRPTSRPSIHAGSNKRNSGSSHSPVGTLKKFGKWIAAIALPAIAAYAAFTLVPPGHPETRDTHWKYVSQAAKLTRESGVEQLLCIDKQGHVSAVLNANLVISAADINTQLRDSLSNAVRKGDFAAAEKLFLAANAPLEPTVPSPYDFNLPVETPSAPLTAAESPSGQSRADALNPVIETPLPAPQIQPPKFTRAIVEALSKDQPTIDFVDFVVFDSCDQDGDVVEVLLDGVSYGVIPLTHHGTRVNIAITYLPAELTVRGVYDGSGDNADLESGGGVTAGFGFRNAVLYARPVTSGTVIRICDVTE